MRLTRPRFTVRRLMVVVAVVGVVLGMIERHYSVWLKYERAARYPWLPVAPDPPEPK